MSDIFLEIPDAPGEATEKSHVGWIPLQSINFGLARHVGQADSSSQHRGVGKAQWQEISVATDINTSSPLLARFCASGKILPKVTIDLCRAGGADGDDLELYLQYVLEHVIITQFSSSGGVGSVPMDQFSMSYSKIEWSYFEFDQKGGGAKGGPKQLKWDLKENKSA